MKVIKLKIENVRKIKALECDFTENGFIEIRGKNKQGKTTILDAMEILLKGKKYIPSDVVTHGADQGQVMAVIGDYIISRTIGEKAKLKITTVDGRPISEKPQTFLDTLVNELTFDPRPFLNKTADQKLKFLMDLLKIDFTEIDNDIKGLSEERTFIGRKVKEFGKLNPIEKTERVNVMDLIEQKNEIENENKSIELAQKQLSEIEQKIANLQNEIKNLEGKKELVKEKAGEKMQDVTPFIEQLEKVEEVNRKADQYIAYVERKKEKDGLEKEYERLTNSIEKKRNEKTKILKSTKMPVKGFEIRHDGVFYNGIHCDNWSDSEAMKISFELCVSMQPKLKAVFIDKGESYDQDSINNLKAWAKKNDIQVFITIVDSSENLTVEDAIYIEDGSIIE